MVAHQQTHWIHGETAFQNYLSANVTKQLGNVLCPRYGSAANAQQNLDAWKKQQLQIVETGWVYKP